ncbi:MAG TPA: zeta toxin family protein [Verrucomicrobiae bacterium]|nr:zeta toxin family protein [Verrucomicrobiae bacterium]
MFAGPNGSGKSSLKKFLSPNLLGIYLNPDEIEETIRRMGVLDCSVYSVQTTGDEVLAFFRNSPFLVEAGLHDAAERLHFSGGLSFENVEVNSYFASVATDFLRLKLLQAKISFTFETVMSHPGKVDLLAKARDAGYRTYLYYIATDDPAINVSRVRNRVKLGGHNVPEGKIVERYYRSLALLLEAIRLTNRAYIFDNSGENRDHTWVAEITEGQHLELKTSQIPSWFKRSVLDKVDGSAQ